MKTPEIDDGGEPKQTAGFQRVVSSLYVDAIDALFTMAWMMKLTVS